MKIVSVDIETTSLNPEYGQVLQIGAVLFDTCDMVFKPLAIFKKYIVQSELKGNIFAVNMNQKIIKRIIDLQAAWKKYTELDEQIKNFCEGLNYEKMETVEKNNLIFQRDAIYDDCQLTEHSTYITIADDFKAWLNKNNAYSQSFDKKNYANVAGKNFFSFDNRFLELIPGWKENVHFFRRTIDPCALYLKDDDQVAPDLKTCKERAITEITESKTETIKNLFADSEVTHDAVDDAMDVAKLIWIALNRNKI